MALLRLAPLVLFVACYSPDTRDCAVTCARAADCESGLVCGADHFCAHSAAAGTCLRADGGVAPPDADDADGGGKGKPPKPDAAVPADARPDARPDAAPSILVHVHVMGPGMVTWAGGGACTNDCMFDVPIGQTVTLDSVPNANQKFDKWTGTPCDSQPATCTFVAATAVDVATHFVKDN